MTVSELIEKLKQYPAGMEVVMLNTLACCYIVLTLPDFPDGVESVMVLDSLSTSDMVSFGTDGWAGDPIDEDDDIEEEPFDLVAEMKQRCEGPHQQFGKLLYPDGPQI